MGDACTDTSGSTFCADTNAWILAWWCNGSEHALGVFAASRAGLAASGVTWPSWLPAMRMKRAFWAHKMLGGDADMYWEANFLPLLFSSEPAPSKRRHLDAMLGHQ